MPRMRKISEIQKISMEEFVKLPNQKLRSRVLCPSTHSDFGKGCIVRFSRNIPKKHKGGELVPQSLFECNGWYDLIVGCEDKVIEDAFIAKYKSPDSWMPDLYMEAYFIVIDGILYEQSQCVMSTYNDFRKVKLAKHIKVENIC